MVGDLNLHLQQTAKSQQVQDTPVKVNKAAQPDWQQSVVPQGEKGESIKNSKLDKSQRPKAVKQLSLRIDDSTHQRISLAAQKAGKSINAWIEEVVSEAADDALGGVDGEINSEAIRLLIEDDDYAVRLIEGVAPYLKDSSPPTIFKFSIALKKLLLGWDRMQPLMGIERWVSSPDLLQESTEEANPVSQLVAALLSFRLEESADSVLRFSTVLKKFLLGMIAVSPFVKTGTEREQAESILNIVMVIEELLREIEANTSAH